MRFIRFKELRQRVPLGRTTIWRMMREGRFPQSRRIGKIAKAWLEDEIEDWFESNKIPAKLLDLDTENKARGSLTHFFDGNVPKLNIHTPAGLDAFVDALEGGPPVILADMGAGAGQVTYDWFERMYPDVAEAGIVFTAIGVITSDPASVESVLAWATRLQHRVAYLIVENSLAEHTDLTYWRESEQAEQFRKVFDPAVIRMDYRLPDLENATRNYGVTLGHVASRAASAPELRRASIVMRAQSYRRRIFGEFDRVRSCSCRECCGKAKGASNRRPYSANRKRTPRESARRFLPGDAVLPEPSGR